MINIIFITIVLIVFSIGMGLLTMYKNPYAISKYCNSTWGQFLDGFIISILMAIPGWILFILVTCIIHIERIICTN